MILCSFQSRFKQRSALELYRTSAYINSAAIVWPCSSIGESVGFGSQGLGVRVPPGGNTFSIAFSNISPVSSAPNSLAVSMNLWDCGFSPFFGGFFFAIPVTLLHELFDRSGAFRRPCVAAGCDALRHSRQACCGDTGLKTNRPARTKEICGGDDGVGVDLEMFVEVGDGSGLAEMFDA